MSKVNRVEVLEQIEGVRVAVSVDRDFKERIGYSFYAPLDNPWDTHERGNVTGTLCAVTEFGMWDRVTEEDFYVGERDEITHWMAVKCGDSLMIEIGAATRESAISALDEVARVMNV